VSSPASIDAMNAAFAQTIPVAANMGVRFTEMRPGFVQATVPFEGNGNHFGVIYAGVIFTVAEVLGGAMHVATFDASTHYPLVRGLSIEFRAPGRGPLTATATLDDEVIAAVRAAAAEGSKVPFELRAEVTAEDGSLVAATVGDYQIRPYGT
jgi:acyl-coenzyme A thioesterase PaaI-like protein